MTKTALENKKIEATEKIEARKDKTTKRGQNAQFAGSVARSAGPIIGALSHIQDKKYFLNLNPVMTGTAADLPGYVNGGVSMPTGSGINFITDYLVGFTLFMPTVGIQKEILQESDINTGFFRLKALLNSMNSRFSNYEGGDLGQLMYSDLEIACAIAAAKRVLACAVHVDAGHIDLARQLVEATGFDYNDVTTNWKNYAARLNVLIDKANQIIRLPKEWSLLNHRLAYNSFVHRDRTKGLVAYHLLVQHVYGKYDETAATVAYDDANVYIVPNNQAMFGDLLEEIADLLARMESTSIINDFTTDMDNAASRGLSLYVIEYIDLHNPKVMFSDDPGMGDSIRNSTSYGEFRYLYSNDSNTVGIVSENFNIKQDTNGYLYQGFLPNSDNISTNTSITGWGTINAWYYDPANKGRPILLPTNPLLASDFTGANFSHNWNCKYVSALDVDDVNTDAGGVLESVRLQSVCETIRLFTRLTSSPSTTGYVDMPTVRVLGTEFPFYSGVITKHGLNVKTYTSVNDPRVVLDPEEILGSYAYGYAPTFTVSSATNVIYWDARVHNLIYVPEGNLENALTLGTLSLFFVDAPLKLGGTSK